MQCIFAAIGSWLHGIPDVVWAALIAAGIAFLSNFLSNRNSRKQLQMQLDATAQREKIEREMALRRDVYLPAIEAITRAQAMLGRLTDINVDQVELGAQLTTDLATISKVHLIASDATIRALMVYTKTLMPAFMELIALRTALLIRKHSIGLAQTYMDASMAEHRRLIQLMKELNIAGNSDRDAMDRLKRQAQHELEFFNTQAKKQAEMAEQQNVDVFALIRRLSELMGPISATIPDALVSARRELDLPLDEAAFRQMFAQQLQAAQSATLNIEAQIKGAMQPKPPSPPPPP
jgi:hypothetical protein